jgi:hypothetical protein
MVAQRGIGTARFGVVQATFDLGQVLAVILDLLTQGLWDLFLKLKEVRMSLNKGTKSRNLLVL